MCCFRKFLFRGVNFPWNEQHLCVASKLIIIFCVEEIFDKVGVVTRAFVNFNNNGRSNGSAEVTFAKKADARGAVREFNGVSFYQNCGAVVDNHSNYILEFLTLFSTLLII